MRIRCIVAVALAAAPTVGCGGGRAWRARDTAMQAGVMATLVVDYAQTRHLTARCVEGNAIMGLCGENVSPAAYFVSAAILHTMVAYALPRRPRLVFQSFTTTQQAVSVRANWRHGYDLDTMLTSPARSAH